ncbi:PilN domain-containing protein [Atopomonas sediminilitoris]|uniref:PilN domain-containing protein n=1 Tax=Atopomonas sediminilitoris TaxID=2919919 RepID=UPI001F4EEF35|nr:PilN domain-containing protein [Atopomonas sediminilitoris]MCJ8170395.1 PilN domain-containing protein [Atopomonas sediminilitoris]
MARINLLPWREKLREERKQRFVASLLGVFIAAAGLVFVAGQYLTSEIEYQTARGDYIKKEIAVLDTRIAEIKQLQERKKQLLERMKIISDLQGNRPVIVRGLDELVRSLPDGVFFTKVSTKENLISLEGIAESNNRVSKLMRQLDASEWLEGPVLTGVKALTAGEIDQKNSFALTVSRVAPQLEGGAK